MDKSPEDMLSAKEVAEWWRVSLRTVRRWVELGRLRPLRKGGTIRFRRGDVVDAADQYEYGGPPPHDPSLG